MATEDHYRKLEHMYRDAPINAFYRPEVKISEGRAEITMNIEEKFHHAANAAHGSIYFKMLDDSAFFAANSLVEDTFVLTTSFNIHLLRPVSQGVIKAVGTLVFSSKLLFVAESKLYNEEGKELAVGSGSFMKSKVTLTDAIGYK